MTRAASLPRHLRPLAERCFLALVTGGRAVDGHAQGTRAWRDAAAAEAVRLALAFDAVDRDPDPSSSPQR